MESSCLFNKLAARTSGRNPRPSNSQWASECPPRDKSREPPPVSTERVKWRVQHVHWLATARARLASLSLPDFDRRVSVETQSAPRTRTITLSPQPKPSATSSRFSSRSSRLRGESPLNATVRPGMASRTLTLHPPTVPKAHLARSTPSRNAAPLARSRRTRLRRGHPHDWRTGIVRGVDGPSGLARNRNRIGHEDLGARRAISPRPRESRIP
jgi:hypothetical protein